jgi:hypothetical protein
MNLGEIIVTGGKILSGAVVSHALPVVVGTVIDTTLKAKEGHFANLLAKYYATHPEKIGELLRNVAKGNYLALQQTFQPSPNLTPVELDMIKQAFIANGMHVSENSRESSATGLNPFFPTATTSQTPKEFHTGLTPEMRSPELEATLRPQSDTQPPHIPSSPLGTTLGPTPTQASIFANKTENRNIFTPQQETTNVRVNPISTQIREAPNSVTESVIRAGDIRTRNTMEKAIAILERNTQNPPTKYDRFLDVGIGMIAFALGAFLIRRIFHKEPDTIEIINPDGSTSIPGSMGEK